MCSTTKSCEPGQPSQMLGVQQPYRPGSSRLGALVGPKGSHREPLVQDPWPSRQSIELPVVRVCAPLLAPSERGLCCPSHSRPAGWLAGWLARACIITGPLSIIPSQQCGEGHHHSHINLLHQTAGR